MRLRSVWISDYKNLKDFSITFEGDGFIEIFVGKNGSGKSNLFEAVIQLFDHIYSSRAGDAGPPFEYDLQYEIADRAVSLSWQGGEFSVDGRQGRQTIGQTPAPDHLLIYYSGQNEQVSDLIQRYEDAFRDELRNAAGPIAPKIIGVGPSCKKLLVVTMLMLPEDCFARQILSKKLGILSCRRSIDLTLKRPFFVQKDDHDPFDTAQLFWGVTGYIRSFIQNLLDSIEGEFTPGQLYDRETGEYRLTCNIDRLRATMGDDSGLTLFRSLEALRVLGMLADIRLPLTLEGLEVSGLNLFSDGQFQSVYLFGIAELFKDLNCVALLDEPDAFLHPEWQFEFLRQVNSISEQAAKTNHFLISSHSASTIAAQAPGRIRLLEVDEDGVAAREKDKSELIRALSAGLISFSEQEAKISVDFVLTNTSGPVLFTEGVSDVAILETAWTKLYGDDERPFEIAQAFDCAFLRNLLKRATLYENHPNRSFFGLFDFDGAFADWKQLGAEIENDVARCLTRKKPDQSCYALLLPVAEDHPLRGQVVRDDGESFGDLARFTIELLFSDVPELEQHFEVDITEPAKPIRFVGDKARFALETVPSIEAQHFERFRPIFEFVRANV